jgi:hypothetical protein
MSDNLPAQQPVRECPSLKDEIVNYRIDVATCLTDLSDTRVLELLEKAEEDADVDGLEVQNTSHDIVAWFAHMVELTGNDGEVHVEPRIILFTRDGMSIGFCSKGAKRELSKVVAKHGVGPWWDSPVTVTFKRVKCGEEKQTHHWKCPLKLEVPSDANRTS